MWSGPTKTAFPVFDDNRKIRKLICNIIKQKPAGDVFDPRVFQYGRTGMGHDGQAPRLNVGIERKERRIVGIKRLVGRERLEAFDAQLFHGISGTCLIDGGVCLSVDRNGNLFFKYLFQVFPETFDT